MENKSQNLEQAEGPRTPSGPPPDSDEDVFVPQTPSGPPPDLDDEFVPHSPDDPPPDHLLKPDEEPEKEKEKEPKKELASKMIREPIRNDVETKKKHVSVYSRAVIHKKIPVEMIHIGKNIKQYIEKYVARSYEGKCIVEGYIKPGSCQIITYSSGIVKANCILFEVVFECLACYPVEGMLIQAIAKNITKAGIRAESSDEKPSPLVIFVARDHHYSNAAFSKIKEGDKFLARVIGQRFELNDPFVSVIAEWMDPNKSVRRTTVRKK
jgi:DNA-directed RNA polymerase subunit E'/Rpb7